MAEGSDHAQAVVFAALLATEIDAVCIHVEAAERLSRHAARTGRPVARLRRDEDARTQRTILYELNRQLDAMNQRFPGCADSARPPHTSVTAEG